MLVELDLTEILEAMLGGLRPNSGASGTQDLHATPGKSCRQLLGLGNRVPEGCLKKRDLTPGESQIDKTTWRGRHDVMVASCQEEMFYCDEPKLSHASPACLSGSSPVLPESSALDLASLSQPHLVPLWDQQCVVNKKG